MQTILGAGGAIGKLLAQELKKHDSKIRLVARNPQRVNEDDELLQGNILEPSVVDQAVSGSSVVYLTVGLEYKYKVWREAWPAIMQNVIDACKKHGSKLVFFDNAYMYDPAHLENLTEETPVNPVSRKGKVRAEIAGKLMREIRSGTLQGMIVRAADFYGPEAATSVMMETVYKKFKNGKRALWMGNPDAWHNMTYTPDAAKATALLGNTPDAYGQVWHLATQTEKFTGRQWINMFASEMGRPPKFTAMSGNTIRLLGIFVPLLRELGEMMYQFDNNYFFNSEKFMRRFPEFKITPAAEGVKAAVNLER